MTMTSMGLSSAAQAESLDMLPFALAGGTPNLDLRLRYEGVEQDGAPKDAEAYTARARLGYTTGKWSGLDAQLEFEGLQNIGSDRYNSTGNAEASYPVVADPEGDEINQAWVRYTAAPLKTSVKYGRQRIILDNARHIGNVGWRQREMTYDGTLLNSTLIPKTTINIAQLTAAQAFREFTVAGKPSITRDLDALLFNVSYAHAKWLTVTAYDYRIDYEPVTTPAAPPDTDTLGLRLSGTLPVKSLTLGYAAEYAQQKDYKDSASTLVDADYLLGELSLGNKSIKGTLGYEVLGANDAGTYGFKTPLATLHAFQGWIDAFLNTPNAGIEDLYVGVSGTVAKFALTAVWHDYSAESGSGDFGSEINLQATYPLNANTTVGLKYADYSADDSTVPGVGPVIAGQAANTLADMSKTWLWLEYKF